ncbi:Hypothetical predicted protein [Olea europaea subsp. europaea]|uniref:Uncharacterized protein n=1 Tax=Olea europaea subsp. europaea TaxID=158383 RepID=A0A8S0QYU8_OLEEU|nr:Hypothetical predicted protein [Olea europaea subsp. europaea]
MGGSVLEDFSGPKIRPTSLNPYSSAIVANAVSSQWKQGSNIESKGWQFLLMFLFWSIKYGREAHLQGNTRYFIKLLDPVIERMELVSVRNIG